jgi:hypothetical protein
MLGLQFLVDGFAFAGAGIATIAAGLTVTRVIRNIRARSELRDVLLNKHHTEIRLLANKRHTHNPEELKNLQEVMERIMEQSAKRLSQEHRKLINEGLEQVSPQGRADYIGRILQKAEEKDAAAHAGHA